MSNLKRTKRKLPSIRKHGLSAVLLLSIILLAGWAWLNFQARNKPTPLPKAVVKLEPVPTPLPDKSTKTKLPDLLEADNIAIDENPTENMKLAGDNKPKAIPPASVGKVTRKNGQILINGRPLSGAKTITKYQALTPAPIDGLWRKSDFGKIPSPSKKGLKPFNAYAKPFKPEKDKSYIAIVVGGLGLNPAITRKAINELPEEVTLSFAAEASGLQSWINQARAHGHEVLIELPMDANDPQVSRPLVANFDANTNKRNLEFLLSRAHGYFAVTNYGGDALLQNEAALIPIVQMLKQSGLGFVYDGGIGQTRILPLGKREGLPAIMADGYLDENSQDAIFVYSKIEKLLKSSYEHTPIGMGFGFEGTIEGIKVFIAAKDAKIGIAPISYAFKTR